MKKTQAFIIVLVFGIPLHFAQEKGFQVFIFGGVNHTFEYGSADDYVQGENDFPITPAHTHGDRPGSIFIFYRQFWDYYREFGIQSPNYGTI